MTAPRQGIQVAGDPAPVTSTEAYGRLLGDLRPYQQDGVGFLVRRDAALLADEMGLGKTVQTAVAIDLCLRQKGCDRALIISPASLRLNWERELNRWAPGLAVKRVLGRSEDRLAYYLLPIPVLIASYEQIRADMPSIAPSVAFDLVILDEAQRIKNRHSAAALGTHLIRRARSWALTGTPVENSPEDLVSIFQFLRPGLLNDALRRSEMHRRMQDHFLRRRKRDVLKDLPPILVQDVPLELDGAQLDAYQSLWDARGGLLRADAVPVSETSMLSLITRLKQVCNFDPRSGESVKFDYLRLVLDALTGTDDKVIVFSQYVETLEWIDERLGAFPRDLFHGALSEGERDRVLHSFETARGPRALLMSLRAGGVGLNLQAASVVVLFDRWWNPAVEQQAVQRAHRFGRDRPLHVIRFTVAQSIENRIAEILAEKLRLIDAFTEGADSAEAPRLTRQELRRMLDLPLQEINN
jgi:SNF2 family DNA or RNA helicase